MSLVAVTSRLALVGAELPVVKFVDPDQMVCDIIESRVYSAGQARGEVVQPAGDTNYLHINKQIMKMLKTKLHDKGFSSTILHIVHNNIFHCLFYWDSLLKHW